MMSNFVYLLLGVGVGLVVAMVLYVLFNDSG